MYTSTTLQLDGLNTKPLCGKRLQAMITFFVGYRYCPQENTKHYQSLYLDCCHILKDYIRHGRPIPVSSVSSSFFIIHFSPFIFHFFYVTKNVTLYFLIQGPHFSVLECVEGGGVGNTVVFPELPTVVYPDILPDSRIPIHIVYNVSS
jgi:hypothetical protein